MIPLKADLHAHTADDPNDAIEYSTEALIDTAAKLRYDVLAVTCHNALVFTDALREYARRRDVLLVPGIEKTVEGKHVLVLNPDAEQVAATTFGELRCLGRRDAAFIAPHPFYPTRHSLRSKLLGHIDLFDAIEYCSLYAYGCNLNRRAVRVARGFGLPMVGTSDAHGFPYRDTTFTWVRAEPSVGGVIQAIRDGRVQPETRPRPALEAASAAFSAAWDAL